MEKIEVLVSTMDKKEDDFSLVKKMNIQTDAIIINQSGKLAYHETSTTENNVRLYTFPERGVGKSRNNALSQAKGSICLMADDDMVYVEGYEDIVKNAYTKFPKADFIVFNVRVHYDDRIEERVKKSGRVRFYNSLKYGTVTFSFKRNKVIKSNVFFPLFFGGGAKFSSGEDTIFLWECLRKGLKVYSDETIIADVYNYESTWFEGYTTKFFHDKGALFKALSPKLNKLFNAQLILRKNKKYETTQGFFDIFKIMNKGAQEFEEL